MIQDDYTYICSLIMARAGIFLGDDKQYLVESRINPVARRHGFPSITEFVNNHRVTRKESFAIDITEAMTTNETFFSATPNRLSNSGRWFYRILWQIIKPEKSGYGARQAHLVRNLILWPCASGKMKQKCPAHRLRFLEQIYLLRWWKGRKPVYIRNLRFSAAYQFRC